MRTIHLTDIQSNSLIKTEYFISRKIFNRMKEIFENEQAIAVILFKEDSKSLIK